MDNSLSHGKKKRSFLKARYIVFPFKVFSALTIGLFIALFFQALLGYAYFSFMFIFLTVVFAFFTMVKKLKFLGVLLIDLLFVLMIILARLYIVLSNNG